VTLRPRLITSRRSSGEAIGGGAAAAAIGDGAALATAVTGVGVALATAVIGGGAAADGGGGKLLQSNQNDAAAQFNLGMARMILASDAAVTRRIRLPMDALSRGAWGG
jgi:hypothetical protein